MKVIAKTENGYILDASADDIAGIEGMYSHEKKINLGDEINIAGLFNRYRKIAIALNDINRLKFQAQSIIDAAEWIKEFMD